MTYKTLAVVQSWCYIRCQRRERSRVFVFRGLAMQRLLTTVGAAVLLVICTGVFGAADEPVSLTSLGDPPLGAPDLSSALGSMFSPEKFSMNQAYAVSVFASGSSSETFGVYSNMISYTLADPLRLDLRLDYVHDPSSIFKSDDSQSFDGRLLPSFSLTYEPNSSFMLRFDYLQGSPRSLGFPGRRWFEDR
jgi:hypothetical protein